MSTRARLFRFPDTVDERAARLVAAGVVLMALTVILLGQHWVLYLLAFGFVARVLAGPRISPLALLVTRVVVPRLPGPARPVPGPPKRFAQGIGATLSVAALVAYALVGSSTAADVLIGMVAIAATLEAAFGLCLGCVIFGWLMRVGVIPSSVCEACNSLDLRASTARR